MLIYELKAGVPYVTQVIHGFDESDISTFKTNFQKIHETHRSAVRLLQDGLVYVTGNSAVNGDGVTPRRNYAHYLDKGE